MGEPLPCPTDFLVRVVGLGELREHMEVTVIMDCTPGTGKPHVHRYREDRGARVAKRRGDRQPKFLKVLGGSGFFLGGGAQSLSLSDTRHLD